MLLSIVVASSESELVGSPVMSQPVASDETLSATDSELVRFVVVELWRGASNAKWFGVVSRIDEIVHITVTDSSLKVGA